MSALLMCIGSECSSRTSWFLALIVHLGHFGMDIIYVLQTFKYNTVYNLCFSSSNKNILLSKYAQDCSSDSSE